MKDDANIKVPRKSYERMRSFALNANRDIREATGVAMEEYVDRREVGFANALQFHTSSKGPKK